MIGGQRFQIVIDILKGRGIFPVGLRQPAGRDGVCLPVHSFCIGLYQMVFRQGGNQGGYRYETENSKAQPGKDKLETELFFHRLFTSNL